jgi:hypothetical protein
MSDLEKSTREYMVRNREKKNKRKVPKMPKKKRGYMDKLC